MLWAKGSVEISTRFRIVGDPNFDPIHIGFQELCPLPLLGITSRLMEN